MKKITAMALLVFINTYAATTEDIQLYINKIATANNAKISNLVFAPRREVQDLEDWELISVQFDYTDKSGKISKASDSFFTKDDFIVQDIYNIKKNISMKTKMSAKPDESYYRESHREIGDINATNKIIVFSDPLCPACRNKIPRLIELAKGSPNKFSVYVYHFPLLHVHPSSEFLVKAMIFAKLKGIDILPIVYSTQFPSDAGLDSTLKKLNEELVSQGIKLRISAKDINTADVLKNYNNDTRDAAKLFVSFTPSIYTNLYPDHALDIVEKINKEK